MSGAPSVPLGLIGYFIENDALRIILFGTAAVCIVISGYLIWRHERLSVIDLTEKITPKLSISKNDETPVRFQYLNETTWRVSVENTSMAQTIDNVWVEISIDGGTANIIDWPQSISHHQIINIDPMKSAYFNILSLCLDTDNRARFGSIYTYAVHQGDEIELPSGQYVVTVESGGRNTLSSREVFDVWTGADVSLNVRHRKSHGP